MCVLATIPLSLRVDAPVLLGLDFGPGCRRLTWLQTLSPPAQRALASEALPETFPIAVPCVLGTAVHAFALGLLSGPSRDVFSLEAALHRAGGNSSKDSVYTL